ncbi:hypothetical protein [Pseudogemmobacter sp. W21_MBD1_M6]|uniref:hypothetical protein n=1 Tax=Pseudogemmobacter sp. W21_MBD1_M6 TaxID=3240271 RepID=UPI003F979245
MNKPLVAAFLAMMALSACSGISQSRLNPFNWFGGSQEEMITPEEMVVASDGRTLVDQVVSFSVEPAQGGAILRATGLPPTQGFWNAELVSDTDEQPVDGVLTYMFRIQQPAGFEQINTERSREVVVAKFVSDYRLAGVRSIRILGERNARTAKR